MEQTIMSAPRGESQEEVYRRHNGSFRLAPTFQIPCAMLDRLRIDEGWRYGPERNDNRKEHPDLVPYEQLSESEKDYDRKTVMEAIKAIIAFGYEIKKKA